MPSPNPINLHPATACVVKGACFGVFFDPNIAKAYANWLGGSIQSVHVLGLDLVQRRNRAPQPPAVAKQARPKAPGAIKRTEGDEITPNAVAKMKRVSVNTVYNALAAGELKERVEKTKKLTYHMIKKADAQAWIPRDA